MDLKHMDLEDLKIDPEFEAAIPPLTEDEFDLLKQSILSEGRLLSPLIIWNGTIVDGHNRYRILLEHPEIDYETLDKDFPDRLSSFFLYMQLVGIQNIRSTLRCFFFYLIRRPEKFFGAAERLHTVFVIPSRFSKSLITSRIIPFNG